MFETLAVADDNSVVVTIVYSWSVDFDVVVVVTCEECCEAVAGTDVDSCSEELALVVVPGG